MDRKAIQRICPDIEKATTEQSLCWQQQCLQIVVLALKLKKKENEF